MHYNSASPTVQSQRVNEREEMSELSKEAHMGRYFKVTSMTKKLLK